MTIALQITFTAASDGSTNSVLVSGVSAGVGDVLVICAATTTLGQPAASTATVTPPGTVLTDINNVSNRPINISVFYFIVPSTTTYSVTINNTNNCVFIVSVNVLSGVNTALLPVSATSASSVFTAPSLVATGNIAASDYILDTLALSTIPANFSDPVPNTTLIYNLNQASIGTPFPNLASALFTRNFAGVKNYSINATGQFASVSIGLFAAQICVARNTLITMADGTTKLIQNITRDDIVAGNLNGTSNKVARLIETKMPGTAQVSLIKINRNALGENQPSHDLIISSGHPILFNGNRYRAKTFKNFNNVQYFSSRTTYANILPVNENNESYSLYNLQFEYDGYFVANNLIVDSVPVNSDKYPLPKELYFNEELFGKHQESNKPQLLKEF